MVGVDVPVLRTPILSRVVEPANGGSPVNTSYARHPNE
jgi:hypothetical protein